jgi:hypothetical protein
MRTNAYELNIYVIDGTVKLIPYRNYLNREGWLETDLTELGLTLPLFMNRIEHRDAIAYVLNYPSWQSKYDRKYIEAKATFAEYWQEHDAWDTTAGFQTSPPQPILAWLRSLPAYDLDPNESHASWLAESGVLNDDGDYILEWAESSADGTVNA